jgi:tetratricopeptide (TPR) repeat protein
MTNGDKSKAVESLRRLERFRRVLSQVLSTSKSSPLTPTFVVAFKNQSSYRPFLPLNDGKPQKLSGYFQRGPYKNYITFDLGTSSGNYDEVIFHELVHDVVQRHIPDCPLWLDEGLAEFLSTSTMSDGRIKMGRVQPGHRYALSKGLLLPLEQIFNTDRDSSLYTDPEQKAVFYAQSLALVHYLMVGKGSSGSQQLARLIHLLNVGMEHAEALRETQIDILNEELDTYIARGEFGSISLDLPTIELERTFDMLSLEPGEVDYLLGDLLLHIRRTGESERFLRQAIDKNPKLTSAYESLGFLHLLKEDRLTAQSYFKQAIDIGSASHLAYYHFARTLTREYFLKDAANSIPDDIAHSAVTALRTSLALRPDFGDAARMLGHIVLERNENITEGITHLEKSLSLGQKKPRMVFILGQLQAKSGDHAGAIESLSWVVRITDDAALRVAAQRELDRLEKHQP